MSMLGLMLSLGFSIRIMAMVIVSFLCKDVLILL